MAIIPIGRNNKELRWKGREVELRFLPEIRTYVEDCLRGDRASDPDLEITADMHLLHDLVICLKNTVQEEARRDDYQLDQSLPPIPDAPDAPPKPPGLRKLKRPPSPERWSQFLKEQKDLPVGSKARRKMLRRLGFSYDEIFVLDSILSYQTKLNSYKKTLAARELELLLRKRQQDLICINEVLQKLEQTIRQRIQLVEGGVVAKRIIPITRFGKNLRWNGQLPDLAMIPEIRAYLDECIDKGICLNPFFKATRDLELMLELVLELEKMARASWLEQPAMPTPKPTLDPAVLKVAQEHELKEWSKWIRTYPKLMDSGKMSKMLRGLGLKSDEKQAVFPLMIQYEKNLRIYQQRKAKFLRELASTGELAKLQAHNGRLDSASRILARLEKKIRRQIADPTIPVHGVPWELLAGGEGLHAQINVYLENVRRKNTTRRFDGSRLRLIQKLDPIRCAIGRGEFDGYVAFFFKRGNVALECAWEGNAIYIFPEDRWIALSKLTKSELLEKHGHELERIIHDSDGRWFPRLKRSLRIPV